MSGKGKERFVSRLVTPGEPLCAPEEFMPGPGTYTDDGHVRAAQLGITSYDFKARVVSVKPVTGHPRVPRTGDVVLGVVVNIRDELATLKIVADEKGENYSGTYTGILHVSQVSTRYVKVVEEAVKMGDLVKVKILRDSAPYQLTLKDARLGVVAAACSNCGGLLVKTLAGQLKCPRCGSVERRKTAPDYLFVERRRRGRRGSGKR